VPRPGTALLQRVSSGLGRTFWDTLAARLERPEPSFWMLERYGCRQRVQSERTVVVADGGGGGPVVYIDRSDVHKDRWDELKAGIRALVAFVDTHQPQMANYGFYLDEDAHQMTVVSVHPDSASLERHMDIGRPEFKKLAPFLALREIEVFGNLSERAIELVQQKAAALGDRRVVMFHEQFAGFDRLNIPSRQ
jgi:hypothetical protein